MEAVPPPLTHPSAGGAGHGEAGLGRPAGRLVYQPISLSTARMRLVYRPVAAFRPVGPARPAVRPLPVRGPPPAGYAHRRPKARAGLWCGACSNRDG